MYISMQKFAVKNRAAAVIRKLMNVETYALFYV